MTLQELHHALGQALERAPYLAQRDAILESPDGPYDIHSLHLEHLTDRTVAYLVGDERPDSNHVGHRFED